MRKIFLLLFVALMSLFGAKAVTTVPVTSTVGNETWYLIKCNPRDASDRQKTWVTVDADDTLRYHAYTGGDEQLWKVVANGTGVALVNKKNNAYLNVDGALNIENTNNQWAKLSVTTTVQTTPLRFVPTTAYTITWDAAGWDATNGGVFIVDNVNTTVNSDLITFNTTAGTRSFCMTSTGSPSFALYSVYGWPGGNPNQAMLFRTQAEAIADVKALLKTAIASANTLYSACSTGPNPGQYATDDMTSLKDAIDAAQAVYDEPTSSVGDYNTSMSDLNTMVSLFKSAVMLPKLSDDFNEYWYFFQGTRPANTYMTSTGAGANVKNKAIVPDDTQLWKLVPNGDGFAFVNKATREYINADVVSNTALLTQALIPAKALKFKVSPETTDKVVRFYVENTGTTVNFRLHAGVSNVLNWTGSATDNCSWLIMDYAAVKREILKTNLANANTIITTTQVGTNPGQVTQAVMDEFKAVVAIQQAVYDDPNKTSDEYMAAGTALTDAKAALKTKANVPVISTDANTVWYTFSGTRPAVTSVIHNNANDSLKYQVLQNNDSELWRFVANGAGFAIQNKATLKYVACDTANYNELKTQVAMPTRPLKYIITDEISQGAFRFLIENDTTAGAPANFRLHAGGDAPMNYADDASDNCGWVIADNAQTVRNGYNTLLPTATTLYNISANSLGTGYALYSKDARINLGVVLADLATKDVNTMDYTQLQTAYNSLRSSYDALSSSRGTDFTSLISTAADPKWLFITGSDPRVTKSLDKRVAFDANNKLVTATIDNTSNLQMWRFDLNSDNSVRMVNKAGGEVLFGTIYNEQASKVDGSGTGLKVKYTSTSIGVCFELRSTDGYQGFMYPSGSTLGAQWAPWLASYDMVYSWKIETVASLQSAVKNTTVNKYLIQSHNGLITVSGVNQFEVYSIMGQRVNSNSALRKGVYIIKVGNDTQKYILR